MNELFSPSSYNINNINIPEEFGLSRELSFFDNPAHKRIKSSIEGNKRNIALPDKTNTIACALLENSHENRESKTLRRCKDCHGIGHYAKTCTAG
ncbi:unnamed protein product [Rhizophagus irregularis]|nr:unnamed protein product [Rhizophagus irregularis]CAB5391519.1 unnamed protein product [Rhizophagus irregularis]